MIAGSRVLILLLLTIRMNATPTLAIMPIKCDANLGAYCSMIPEIMSDKLLRLGNYRILDQTNINEILKRMALEQSGFYSESDAAKVGKLLNADMVIVGSYAQVGEERVISAKIVSMETGLVSKSAVLTSTKGEDLETLVERLMKKLILPTCTASSSIGPDFAAEFAFDENNATFWQAAAGNTQGWLEIKFLDSKTFSHASFTSPATDMGSGVPKNFSIQYWSDGKWIDAVKELGNMRISWRGDFSACTSSRWRIYVESVIDPSRSVSIAEFKLE